MKEIAIFQMHFTCGCHALLEIVILFKFYLYNQEKLHTNFCDNRLYFRGGKKSQILGKIWTFQILRLSLQKMERDKQIILFASCSPPLGEQKMHLALDMFVSNFLEKKGAFMLRGTHHSYYEEHCTLDLSAITMAVACCLQVRSLSFLQLRSLFYKKQQTLRLSFCNQSSCIRSIKIFYCHLLLTFIFSFVQPF